jgi:hypothetical protein
MCGVIWAATTGPWLGKNGSVGESANAGEAVAAAERTYTTKADTLSGSSRT